MASLINQFVTGLKSRNDEVKMKAAKDLYTYVSTELREASIEDINAFLDEFGYHIRDMVNSSDVNEKKGGILAILSLINLDVGNTNTVLSRCANFLRNLLPSADYGVRELTAKAVGKLAGGSGTYRREYVEFEVKKAFEWLSEDRNEEKRHAAVLVLRELAINMPTFFYQQVQQFFDCIFVGVRDPKLFIREGAVAALHAALVVTSQRENKESENLAWYTHCYDEALKGFEESGSKERSSSKDDRIVKIHGSLLVFNELLRISHLEFEKTYQELELFTNYKPVSDRTRKDSITNKLKFPSFGLPQKACLNPFASLPGPFSTSEGKQVLHESYQCKEILLQKYDEMCALVLRQRGQRNIFIQQALLTILPRLAAFNRNLYVESYLGETMLYLFDFLKREKDRNSCFITIGLIAVGVGGGIRKYLGKVMDIIRSILPSKEITKKRSQAVDPSIFTCISLLARAVKLDIKDDIRDMLDPMLTVGLSFPLTACLKELAVQIPHLKRDIADGLLKMLSHILLMRQVHSLPSARHSGGSSGSLHNQSYDGGDVQSIVLALRTLGTFDFEGHSLMQFVKQCAEQYLSHEHKEVRIEAVRTCSHLLCPALVTISQPGHFSKTVMQTVADVLSKLLMVGVIDTDSDVRYCVLASLDETFDGHLAQPENLSALFVALNDEKFEIREIALCTIGRLSTKNPAYVLPSLRKVLIQLLIEIEHSGVGRNKEQAARLLSHLIANTPRLIRPYMEPIMKVLFPKLKEPDPNVGVVISVLMAVGEQAQVSGADMKEWTKQLLPVLIEMLQDSSNSQKRETALWTLGQLIESTGYVIEPYLKYPVLLEMLLNFLKTEQAVSVRRETIRVLGLLGALDPYKYKLSLGMIDDQGIAVPLCTSDKKEEESYEMSPSEMLVNLSSGSLEEFYPAIAVATLMKILKEPNLHPYHSTVVQAVTFIFKSLGVKCVPYIQQVLPSFLNVIRFGDSGLRDFLFQQLGALISIVKQHIRNYLDDVFALIKEFWTVNSPLQSTIILLVENISVALGSEFKVYLAQLIPQILRVFMYDTSKDRIVTNKMLLALQKFGSNLDDYLHLILPPLVRLFDSSDVPLGVRKTSLETIERLTTYLDFTDYASRVIHPLVRTLDCCPDLRPQAMDTLSAMVLQLGKKYQVFIPLVYRVINKHKIQHQRYEVLTCRIVKGTVLSTEEEDDPVLSRPRPIKPRSHAMESDSGTIKKLTLSPTNLQVVWDTSKCASREDWIEWMRRLSIELVKESPSPVLRSCYSLAQKYLQFPRELFNAAFVSCWTELSEKQQDELIHCLEQALTAQDIPEITQTLLNLTEFMEHCEKGPLPIDPKLLGARALSCRAYAKALHYKEDEFHQGPTTEVLGSLISINHKLQQKEAAAGLLEYGMKNHKSDLEVKESWYEKLQDWESALGAYEKKQEQCPEDKELTLGRMRCLQALGKWRELHELARSCNTDFDDEERMAMARMASAASWGLHQWADMEEYVHMLPVDTMDGSFYRAVLNIHKDQYALANQFINASRDILDTELTAMASESYQRAYSAMVQVQMLSELEEVIAFKLIPERREIIKQIWWERLMGCQRLVEDWQRILQVRSMVISPHEDTRTWLKYASLCRKSGRLSLSLKPLMKLLGKDLSLTDSKAFEEASPVLLFAYAKYNWMAGMKDDAFKDLKKLVQTESLSVKPTLEETDKSNGLLAKCYLKLGQWQENLQGINEDSIPFILEYYSYAKKHDPSWYKAWHAWAYMNFECVLFYNRPGTHGAEPKPIESPKKVSVPPFVFRHAVPAVEGFVKSISLSKGSCLQDTLRLLTLCFDYGHHECVFDALSKGISTIKIETWLEVIPQLIARIDIQRSLPARLVHQLLMDIGKHHPQALIYPLTVASKSNATARSKAANKILMSMVEHNNVLVQQAVLVSDELIRMAILWHEKWHEGLEEASRLYFGERSIEGMFATLEPLHEMMKRGPQTLKETSFNQAYGRDLQEAQDWCRKYERSNNIRDLNQAWDLYYHVFRRISKQLPQLTSLELQYVSPNLLKCRDLELAVPGSYHPRKPIVRIAQVQSSLQVITSKQRPRKLVIKSDAGKDYMFLLKGHEDLRQDERVMQLFGLLNTLLLSDPETFRRNLTIQRYAVIPLSTKCGLIGWVPHCDTLHTLIRDYREKKKILLNIEHRIMLRMAPDYDHLTLMQKVGVFEHALEHTNGDDLAKLLWLKSPSSEVWFDRRCNYTRSLAVMSMVGYVLGLGDRHPSNLMLDRMSGKVIHIDFGDCFEVAMNRDKFPERIPFRLTRMLINAMEVTGIEGTYRMTCQSVMTVLRKNKDSLMAVLEAFVYDPLLNWRLMDTNSKAKRSKGRNENPSSMGGDGDSCLDDISSSVRKVSQDDPKDCDKPDALNAKAVEIISRVKDKLTGRDFPNYQNLEVQRQIDLLIEQATSHENLCQCYIGWCPFW